MTDETVREGRRERRARETRRNILTAALELFDERGVDDVTVEQIADRADVARATVFNYFATKQSLCESICDLQMELLRDAIEDGQIDAPSTAEKITQALGFVAELPGRNPEHCRTILTRALAALRPGELPEHRLEVFRVMQSWVEEGQERGELRSDRSAAELAGFIMGLQLQATITWAYGFAKVSLAEHQAQILRLGLEGMRTR